MDGRGPARLGAGRSRIKATPTLGGPVVGVVGRTEPEPFACACPSTRLATPDAPVAPTIIESGMNKRPRTDSGAW